MGPWVMEFSAWGLRYFCARRKEDCDIIGITIVCSEKKEKRP